MKVAALAAFLLFGYVADLFAKHDAQGDLGAASILIGYTVAAVVAALVLGYTAWRFDAERKWRSAR